LHISQLSRDNIEDVSELISEGEIHLLRIISLDTTRQRIGLSLKGVSASEQIEWMSQREAAEEAEVASDASEEAEEVEATIEDAESIEATDEAIEKETTDEDLDTDELADEPAAEEESSEDAITGEVEIDESEIVDVAAAVDQALAELDEEE
jgi:small subunit ribosomal protein S1